MTQMQRAVLISAKTYSLRCAAAFASLNLNLSRFWQPPAALWVLFSRNSRGLPSRVGSFGTEAHLLCCSKGPVRPLCQNQDYAGGNKNRPQLDRGA